LHFLPGLLTILGNAHMGYEPAFVALLAPLARGRFPGAITVTLVHGNGSDYPRGRTSRRPGDPMR